MKKNIRLFLTFILLIISIEEYAQHKIGVNISPLVTSEVFTFGSRDGAAVYDNDNAFSFGASYTYCFNKKIEFQTGIEYSKNNIIIKPAFTGIEYDNPSRKENFKLISFPMMVNLNFGKYIFLNGGLLFDFEISKSNSIDRQTGLGTMFGLGVKYDFDSGISLYMNPNLKLHTLIPFSSGSYYDRVFEAGIKVGITYSLSE